MANFDITKLRKLEVTLDRVKVIDLGSGALPRAITVELPGQDRPRVAAWWTGHPPNLAVDDYVRLQRVNSDAIGWRVIDTAAGTAARSGGAWPPDGKAMINTTLYDTITAALAAASSGDVVKVGPGEVAESFTIPSGVVVTGSAKYGTVITGVVTMSDGAFLERVKLNRTANCITASAGTAYISGCEIVGGTSIVLASGTAILYLYDSSIKSYGPSVISLRTTDTGIIRAFFCQIENTISGNGGAIYLSNCSRLNGSYTGDVRGVLQDADEGFIIPYRGSIVSAERTGHPSSPPTGSQVLYFYDGRLWRKDNAGVATQISPLDINSLTDEAAADDADSIAIYDSSAGAVRKQTRANFLSGVGSGWPFDDVITVGGPSADYQTLQDAIDACSGGEQIEVGIDVTEDVTVDVAVEVYGATKDIAIIGHFILTAAAKVRNLTLLQTGTDVDNVAVSFQTDNALVEDCIIRATGAGTNNYAVSMFGSYTGNELRNCDVLASGAANNYGAHLAGVAGTPNMFIITGGRFSGTTDDIYLNKSDMTLTLQQSPVLVNNDLNAAFGTVNGNYNDVNGNVRLAKGEDFYPDGDAAGLFSRVNAGYPYTDHLIVAPSLTWASYVGFVTPTVNASLPSHVWYYYNGGTAGSTKFFGYLSNYYNSFAARCSVGIANGRAGIRMDDGSMTNYVELFVANDSGMMKVQYRWSGGAGAVTDWLGGARIFPKFFILRFGRVGDTVYMFAHEDTYFGSLLGAVSFGGGWTPTRVGIFGEHPNGGIADIQYAPIFDSIYYA